MARKAFPKNPGKSRGLVVVVAKPDRGSGERMRGGDGHKLGGRPHAADARRDLGRDPFKGEPFKSDQKRDRKD